MEHVDFSHSHDTQRTCLNGHVISNEGTQEPAQPFCQHCGLKTISACPSCGGPLLGADIYREPPRHPLPDAYCLHCGKPLPWTEARLSALKEMAEVSTSLDERDRAMLSQILPDLTAAKDTPRTHLAILKMKELLRKGGTAFAESAQKIFVEVVSETVRKALFP